MTQVQFVFEQYTNNLSVEARTPAGKAVSVSSLERLDPDDEVLRRACALLAAAARRQDAPGDAAARIDGFAKHTDFQLLAALRALHQDNPEHFANSEFCHEPLKAKIDVHTPETLELHAPVHGTYEALTDAKLFGYETLWGYTPEMKIFELDLHHGRVLHKLSEKCATPLPSTYTKTFLEQNYHNEGRLGRTKIDAANAITAEHHSPTPRIYLREQEEELVMQLRFAYNDHEVQAGSNSDIYRYNSGSIIRVPREEKTEKFYTIQFKQNNVRPTRDGYAPRNDAYAWLADDVQELLALGFEVYGRHALVHNRVSADGELRVRTKKGGSNWLDLEVQASLGDEDIPVDMLAELLRKGERYVKLADGSTGVELTPLGGHLISGEKGVHHAENPTAVPSRVSGADRSARPSRAKPEGAGRGVRAVAGHDPHVAEAGGPGCGTTHRRPHDGGAGRAPSPPA